MLNSCNFIGRLTKEPELRESPSGLKLVNFTIAVGKKFKDKDGEKKEKTEFVKCVAFDAKANYIGSYIHKGDLVYVNGEYQTREFNDKNGVKKYETHIMVNDISSLNNGKKTEQVIEQASEQDTEQATDDEIPF